MSADQLQSTRDGPRAYRSPIAAIVYDGVQAMHRLGLISTETLHAFDRRCLTSAEPKEPAP